MSITDVLETCDPQARFFPLTWKETYFRLNFNGDVKGYVCPICQNVFRGPSGFKLLKADHIYPYSKGGLTTWENLQLLCLSCNATKSNKV